MSRLALLDIFLAFLAGLRRQLPGRRPGLGPAPAGAAASSGPARSSGLGPLLFLRPWRIAAGVCFGLACGTKWSAIYVLAAFGLLVWAWDSGARRTSGLRHPTLKVFVVDELPSVVLDPAGRVRGVRAHVDRLAAARGRVREGIRQADWGTYWRNDATGSYPRRPVAPFALALPPRPLRLPHRCARSQEQQWRSTRHTYQSASRRVADPQPSGRGGRAARHPARRPGLRSATHVPAPGAAPRDTRAVVGRHRWR